MIRENPHPTDAIEQLWPLLELLCEGRSTETQMRRIEDLVLNDPEARRFYFDYVELHGTLHWDLAQGTESGELPALVWPPEEAAADGGQSASPSPPEGRTTGWTRWLNRSRYASAALIVALSVCAVLAVGWWLRPGDGPPDRVPGPPVAGGEPGEQEGEGSPQPAIARNAPDSATAPDERTDERLPRESPDGSAHVADRATPESVKAPEQPQPDPPSAVAGSTEEAGHKPLTPWIDERIRLGWKDADVEPSPRADDGEWLRRVYLDIVGHIPPPEVVEEFLNDASSDKRALLVDRLLDDPDYVHNWTTVWTNLLIGRSSSQDVDRAALQKFLRESFAANRPWNEIVYDLVSAEGGASENGAANFLLAHLNNDAVPATAITARIFLGTQVQCTQCHNHPFNDWTQNRFWELNSFFQQTARVRRRKRDPRSGRMRTEAALVNKEVGGPIYYETRRGLMKAAFPKFAGEEIEADADVNRRRKLARLMTQENGRLMARALVNRMWSHFFGYGFTQPVDDMGPHNPPTHPELLDRLTEEFIAGGYDLKQLIRWIATSEAYQLTSRFQADNRGDDPAAGRPPAFSRMYVKSMTPEQVYDSLLVATRAHYAGQESWSDVARQRQKWLQQFVTAFRTEENDEATTFHGTIPQALVLMNSELVDRALSLRPGTVLYDVATQRGSLEAKIERLFLAALAREPTAKELRALRKRLQRRIASAGRGGGRQTALMHGLQDVFWALLNSNEFILVH